MFTEKVASNQSHAVDTLRILDIGVAGLYVNKSGKGNCGWDVRACLVDEDYAGFVSASFTKPVTFPVILNKNRFRHYEESQTTK